jgi:hypothetical protein
VSARASIGKKEGALFEKRQVAEAGKSSSALLMKIPQNSKSAGF